MRPQGEDVFILATERENDRGSRCRKAARLLERGSARIATIRVEHNRTIVHEFRLAGKLLCAIHFPSAGNSMQQAAEIVGDQTRAIHP